jgi:hypothetical protein
MGYLSTDPARTIETEAGLSQGALDDCKGVRVLEWLEKDGASSLREYIAQLERRLTATPRLVEGHKLLRRLKAMRLPRDKFEKAQRGILTAFPEMRLYYFPPGYNVRSVAEELAQVRCKLSRARLNFQIWHRTGRPPRGAGFVRLCSAPPVTNRPLTLWTIRGFPPNDATLNQSQLAEIGLIARGLARNPRTRSGMPILTIRGGFAPGENASVGDARAIAVKGALTEALKRIDLSLLGSVGFNLTAEAWCSEVSISLRERIAPPPDLRLRVPLDHPLVQPRNRLAPAGTPLPPLPRAGPSSGRSVQDQFRNQVDSILRKYGVTNEAVRRAIADSAVFQSEEALRAAIGTAGVGSDTKQAIFDSIRALSQGRPR